MSSGPAARRPPRCAISLTGTRRPPPWPRWRSDSARRTCSSTTPESPGLRDSYGDVSAADWWRAFEINIGGAVELARLVLPGMIAAGSGRIINVTSYAAVYRWPLMSAYAASKAALVKLTETLAEETRSYGVSVFSADPGLLPIGLTDMAVKSTAGPQTPEGLVFGWIRGRLASGQGADPDQAARLVLALASGRCDRLSGRHLTVADDLDALLERIDAIIRDDLHTLRLRTTA